MILPEALFARQQERTPHEELAIAVVKQAVEDFAEVRLLRSTYPRNDKIRKQYEELKEFFSSEWFDTLMPYRHITGEIILKEMDNMNPTTASGPPPLYQGDVNKEYFNYVLVNKFWTLKNKNQTI